MSCSASDRSPRRILATLLSLSLVGFLACAGELEDPERFGNLTPGAGAGGTGGSAGTGGSTAGTTTAGTAGTTSAGAAGAAAGSAGSAGSAPVLDISKANVTNGEKVATTNSCPGCHGTGLVGAIFSNFWAPNLTPDEATGLGTWTPGEIAGAIRNRDRKDGTKLCSLMSKFDTDDIPDSDLIDLIGYLKQLPATNNPSKAADCK